MTDTNKMQIEINGVKMEIDTRYAKRIETLKVGDRVKVLTKGYSDYKVSHGVIIGFEPFHKLPTIIVAHMEIGYKDCDLKFTYYNAETKDVEVVAATDDDALDLDKEAILKQIDQMIAEKQAQIITLEERKSYFLSRFKKYWSQVEEFAA